MAIDSQNLVACKRWGLMNTLKRMQKRILVGALLLVALLSTLISLTTPLFEPPDELQHYQFVRYLIDYKQLPVQQPDGPVSQSHQPPFYYLGGALLTAAIPNPQTLPERNLFWGYDDNVSRDNKLQFLVSPDYSFPYQGTARVVHVLRLWSILLSLITVLAVWQLGQLLWPDNSGKVALLLALSVLNPMFLYMSGAANNDSMVIMFGALLLWLTVRGMRDGFTWRTTILIGFVWGGALLSKLTGLMLVTTWGTALLWTAWSKRDWHLLFSRTALILTIATGVAGWWFIRNQTIYHDPLALQIVLDVWGERIPENASLANLWPDVRYSWTNFWGRFGYGQVPMPSFVYLFFLAVSLLAGSGGLLWLSKRPSCYTTRRAIWLVLLLSVMTYGGALFYYIFRNPTGANGRYVFPALPAIAAILTGSLGVWLDRWQRPFPIYPIFVALLAGMAVFTSTIFLPWTYARPRLLSEESALAQVQRPANVVWDDAIRLVGTAVSPHKATDQSIRVTACWQAKSAMSTNYTLFIRLLDANFNSLGQRDTHPGLGTFPTTLWQPSTTFCDTYPIPITAELTAPTVVNIDLGFNDPTTDVPLPSFTETGEPVSQVIIDQIKLLPPSPQAIPQIQYQLNAQFAQGVQLIGYNLSAIEIHSADKMTLELVWQADGPLDDSYTVFAHLLDDEGNIITQADGLPRNGRYPTSFWGAGDVIIDPHTFTLPADAPSGPTTLRVGFYRLADFSRLPRSKGSDLPDSVEMTGPIIIGQAK
jgi:4-amino-4-deoxy-L-arabinose transferase-like glycosyltransferase